MWVLSDIQEELLLLIYRLFKNIEDRGFLPNTIYEADIMLINKADRNTTKK